MKLPSNTKIIVCGVVKKGMQSLLPPDISIEELDSDLHLDPKELKSAIQKSIDSVSEEINTIILGFGLCSLAMIGITAKKCKLIIPRIDDCIALFLGSRDSYHFQTSNEPATYYLTKDWLDAGITPFQDYEPLVSKYGQKQADFMMGLVFKDFKRLALIKNEKSNSKPICDFARHTAQKLGLRYEEIVGSNGFFKKLLFGPWDDDFVIVKPGHVVAYSDFKNV